MLCLSRKPGQSVRIGDAVLHFKQIQGGRVQVAIEAPKAVLILRGELRERKVA